MSVVQALYEKTEDLHELVSKGLPQEEREAYIDKLNQLLSEREALMKELSGGYSDEEKAIGQKMVALNQKLVPLLNDQLKVIETDIGNFNRKKSGRNKYNATYQRISNDGMFLDKKK